MTSLDHAAVPDQAEVEAFAGTMIEMLDHAAAALMISIGHQVGLFDTMAATPGATSQELAAAAGLNERYVREWLGAVTTAGIVDYAPASGTYTLPPAHAAALTRAAGPNNLARVMQFIAQLGEVEHKIVERFRVGGGLSYDDYARFHALMAEESAEVFDAALIDVVLPMSPGLTDRLLMGMDVADIACGSGHAVNLMARAFPASRFRGYDFSADAIAAGRAEAEAMGLTNVKFVEQDVARLHAPESCDLITVFDAIHDQAHPAEVLANIAEALRPDGVFLMVDIHASSRLEDNADLPLGPFLYTVSTMHCMSVSLGQGGDGLGTVWGEQRALSMLADAGFTDVHTHQVDGDPLNTYYVAGKG
ncbi:class I SAM-dependent methyltransferase [Nocardia asteroides]|uniref:class I SAM-dependent methyltransferase n=1 Tax=Nocardia asteroides TaxID=1824 RepID=UPI001E3874D3|nr:class I SAM-dependent methyltransferase [Nocardia asteroides]UGT53810.1 class I SAM-dependent methyltransferase [Nocardia asteroides]